MRSLALTLLVGLVGLFLHFQKETPEEEPVEEGPRQLNLYKRHDSHVARPLVDNGATPEILADMTLGEVPASPQLDRLRARRAAVGLPAGDDAPLLIHPDGTPVLAAERINWLRSQADLMEKWGSQRVAHRCREQATAA